MHTDRSSYDVVAYPSYTHPQTHPSRLAVIGSLYGLDPARVERCRVLELGCGNGSNLAPMAEGLPDSEFVGVDLAAQPIAYGQKMIREVGLKNIRLQQGDLAAIEPGWGKFDYLIAHGVFSWVPAGVRDGLLRVCRDLLNPQGLAFISYNALPGCHLRNMVREMMLFHVRGFESAPERVQQARSLAKFIAEAQDTGDAYRQWMKAELEGILEHEAGHLYHDELAEISQPFYFTQFVQMARARGLQYVGEADYFEMFDHGFSEATRQTLKELGQNRILHEQYLDFLKCRRFRQTLLCLETARLAPEPLAEKVTGLLTASAAKVVSGQPDLRPGVSVSYQAPKGAKCTTDFALGKAALAVLEPHWPQPLAFDALFQATMARLAEAGVRSEAEGDPRTKLAAFLLEIYGAGLVEFRTCLPPVARSAGEKPLASPMVRWQAQNADFVASRFHVAVQVQDEIGRLLLGSLDGTRDRAGLLDQLQQRFQSKNAPAPPPADEAALRQKLSLDLEANLAKLAHLGLLVA